MQVVIPPMVDTLYKRPGGVR